MEIVPIASFLGSLLPDEELRIWDNGRSVPATRTVESIADRPASDCTVCPGAIINSVAELRAHFKTDWHLRNLRARQSGEPGISESEFTALAAAGKSSSDSGSAEECSSDEDSCGTPGTPMVRFYRPCASQGRSIAYEMYKSVVCTAEEIHEGHGVDCDSKELKLRLANIVKSTWLLLLIRSGRVACAIFDNHDGKMLRSRTFKRYTVRRKQGGSQLARDAAGSGRSKSAGAHIRRRNELHLIEDVQQLLAEWCAAINQCSLVFWNPTMTGRLCLADSSVLGPKDGRLCSIPFTTHRPSLEEVQRCYQRLSGVHLVRLAETSTA